MPPSSFDMEETGYACKWFSQASSIIAQEQPIFNHWTILCCQAELCSSHIPLFRRWEQHKYHILLFKYCIWRFDKMNSEYKITHSFLCRIVRAERSQCRHCLALGSWGYGKLERVGWLGLMGGANRVSLRATWEEGGRLLSQLEGASKWKEAQRGLKGIARGARGDWEKNRGPHAVYICKSWHVYEEQLNVERCISCM